MRKKLRSKDKEYKFNKFDVEADSFKLTSGITLISLVITIIVLIILSAVAIYLSLGNNGIFIKTKEAKEITNKQEATDIINLKITTAQMNKYADEQRMPTLKELSEVLKEDDEILYVTETSQIASEKYEVGENPSSIFTKLNDYPYEFEINGQLQLASINGVKIANSAKSSGKKVLWTSNNESGTTEIELEEKISDYDLLIVNFKIAGTPRTMTLDTTESNTFSAWYGGNSYANLIYISTDLENNKVTLSVSKAHWGNNYIDKIIGIKL